MTLPAKAGVQHAGELRKLTDIEHIMSDNVRRTITLNTIRDPAV